jgi:nucleoside-diphosphate-sugar epimerase
LDFLPAKIVDHFRRKARTIELGNLEVARDFSDVRDVVRAYRSLLEAPVAAKTFNVCSGTSHSLASMLRTMSDIAGYEINVEVNPAFVRQNEIARLEGDPSALRTAIGFFPSRPLSETLRWMYNASSQD